MKKAPPRKTVVRGSKLRKKPPLRKRIAVPHKWYSFN